ncbi:MAG: TonB-dependent receptor plug domain-containing protein [Gemmatimonadota bacterium]|nr:TonB-dependent receptor plug domain-containing protein [Gemmatimonadota bacterium]
MLQTLVALVVISGTLGCSSSSGATPKTSATPKADPDLISTAEIDSQSFRDAYDVVQRLRPTWFTRKSGSSSARRMGVSGSGLVVYLDNARMGGVDALRQLNTSAIESLRFMDAATATATLPGLGSSVIAGAIVVRTRRGF